MTSKKPVIVKNNHESYTKDCQWRMIFRMSPTPRPQMENNIKDESYTKISNEKLVNTRVLYQGLKWNFQ